MIQKSVIADFMPQLMRREAKGNIVEYVTATKTGAADKDFGVLGTVQEIVTALDPEPFINAVNVTMVIKSGGAFRYSDLKMTVARDSITEDIAMDPHTEFNVNGKRYNIVSATPGPSAWEFVIRAQALTPTTP